MMHVQLDRLDKKIVVFVIERIGRISTTTTAISTTMWTCSVGDCSGIPFPKTQGPSKSRPVRVWIGSVMNKNLIPNHIDDEWKGQRNGRFDDWIPCLIECIHLANHLNTLKVTIPAYKHDGKRSGRYIWYMYCQRRKPKSLWNWMHCVVKVLLYENLRTDSGQDDKVEEKRFTKMSDYYVARGNIDDISIETCTWRKGMALAGRWYVEVESCLRAGRSVWKNVGSVK